MGIGHSKTQQRLKFSHYTSCPTRRKKILTKFYICMYQQILRSLYWGLFGVEVLIQFATNHLCIPRLDHPAPKFTTPAVVNNIIVDLDLDTYLGNFVVLLFYPQDFTFVCPTEIISFGNKSGEFAKLGTVVIGISTDSVHSHQAWIKTSRKEGGLQGTSLILAADPSHKIGKLYGVLNEETGYVYRALFILDSTHMVRQVIINDSNIGRNVDEVMRLVKAIQFTDEYGEVCPANWIPGNEGLQKNMESVISHITQM